jgi:threonyl-tRNA synthetase
LGNKACSALLVALLTKLITPLCLCRDPGASITLYHIGEPGDKEHWWDLCAGPHVESTGKLNSDAIELERTAGAYWRGDEKNQMLTRVYGTAWTNEVELEAYKFMQEEALRRDHRKLGQQLELFSIQVLVYSMVLYCLRFGTEIEFEII